MTLPSDKARLFKVRPALADQIRLPGGRRIGDVLAAADNALEASRDGALECMGASVAQLEALTQNPAPGDFARLYPMAAELAGMAGFFETGAFYKAAYSLCELTEKLTAAGLEDWPSARAHVQALRLILNSGFADGPEAEGLLDGLAALVRKAEAHTA